MDGTFYDLMCGIFKCVIGLALIVVGLVGLLAQRKASKPKHWVRGPL